MTLEIRHIRAFHAVAHELSFRRASERLGVTQPALSRTIKSLEQTMQIRLIERTTRVIRLTEPGKVFLKHTKDLIANLEHAMSLAQRAQSGFAGELRVGFNDFAISDQLPEIVRRFRTDHADVEVNLVDQTTPEALGRVLDGTLDVAFHSTFQLDEYSQSVLDRIVVRDERIVCVLPAAHPLARARRIAVADLANEPFIMGRWSQWQIFHILIRSFCNAHGFTPRIVQEAEHSDGIMGLVAAGMGVTLYVHNDGLHVPKGIAVRPLREPPPKIQTLATWRRDRRESWPTLDHFLQTVSDVVRP
jgi:DNA-binding transcriptional LysR family regulator